MDIAGQWTLEDIDSIKPHPDNPRRGRTEVIAESILENGFYGFVLVQASTRHIIAGEHRWRALRELQEAGALVELITTDGREMELPKGKVPLALADVDDATAKRIMLADNRTSDVAGHDAAQLAKLLQSLDTLKGTGFDHQDVKDLLASLKRDKPRKVDPDAIPETVKPRAQRGQVWQCGDHRIMCGDSTSLDDMKKLLEGRPWHYCFTSPPYAIDLEYEEGQRLDALQKLIEATLPVLDVTADPDAYLTLNYADIFEPGDPGFTPTSYLYTEPLDDLGWVLRGNRIWLKPFGRLALAYGTSTTMNLREWEYVRTWRKGKGAEKLRAHGLTLRGVWKTFGADAILEDWRDKDITTDKATHPAAFPVVLPATGIRAYTDAGQLVLDPFAGSGSTLIAAEMEGRAARLMEIEPRYVDVAVARYEAFTDTPAELVKDTP